MLDAINRFRRWHGKNPVSNVDWTVSSHCGTHCQAMASEHKIYHAPDYYLNGWREAVAMMSYNDYWKDRVVFDIFGTSGRHADVLLDCNTIAYNTYISNWTVYVCVRGI